MVKKLSKEEILNIINKMPLDDWGFVVSGIFENLKNHELKLFNDLKIDLKKWEKENFKININRK